jgi:hypothetical protein
MKQHLPEVHNDYSSTEDSDISNVIGIAISCNAVHSKMALTKEVIIVITVVTLESWRVPLPCKQMNLHLMDGGVSWSNPYLFLCRGKYLAIIAQALQLVKPK